MKKLIILVFALLMVCTQCLAEEVEAVSFDLTEILSTAISLIAALLYGLILYAWKKYIKPWLVQSDLGEVAMIVVEAVEAIVGRGNGEKKLDLALEKMKAYGYNIDNEVVLDAVRSAWKKLDLNQIMAGEKKKPPEEVLAE